MNSIADFVPLLIIVALVVWYFRSKAKKSAQLKESIYGEAEAFLERVKQNRGIAPCSSPILLKENERCFFEDASELSETRSVRQFKSGSAGVRVAKGVYIGATKGKSVGTQEWAKLDAGRLTVTNKRIVFTGTKESRSLDLRKLVSVEPGGFHAICVSVENRQKAMVFQCRNSLVLVTIIRLCAECDNVEDIGETALNISYAR
ncbi:MAG: hypothetical protein A2V79_02640 [Betaproteobacteria bacterium RBG_16_56_24]|nr:MAG: hypothetical protein A2V79_02640 [Betaproteobacteria bacterium RBG_16_56_24]